MAEGRIAQYISHEFKTASNGGEYVAVKVNYEGKSVTWRGFQTAVASFRAALAAETPLTYGQWREWTVQLGKPRTTDSGQTYENTNLMAVGNVAKAPQNVPAPAASGRRGGGGGWQPRSPVETESIERQTALNHAVRSVGKYFEFCGEPPEDHDQWIEHVLHEARKFARFIHERQWSEGDTDEDVSTEVPANAEGSGDVGESIREAQRQGSSSDVQA